jgi:hypothetical protein
MFSPTYALIWSVKTPTIGNAFHLKDLNIATGFNPFKNVYESFPTNPQIFANAFGICKDLGVRNFNFWIFYPEFHSELLILNSFGVSLFLFLRFIYSMKITTSANIFSNLPEVRVFNNLCVNLAGENTDHRQNNSVQICL